MIWNKIRTYSKDGGVVWVSPCQEVISCLICSLFGCLHGFLPSVGQSLLVIVHIIASYFRVCLWYQYSTPVNNYRNIFKIESSSAQFSNPAWIGWRSADSTPNWQISHSSYKLSHISFIGCLTSFISTPEDALQHICLPIFVNLGSKANDPQLKEAMTRNTTASASSLTLQVVLCLPRKYPNCVLSFHLRWQIPNWNINIAYQHIQ